MFLVRAATTQPSPDTPTVLTGYGGFAVASTPAFGPGIVAWCDMGGVFALAGIRGGSEYGEEWHRAGMLHAKQQVFEDFAAAADWLVAEGWTSRERLAVRGGSNGGLLVGAAVTQRPGLCRAVVCAVPLLDMVRYHRFLIGALWVPEYGDPDDPEQFEVLAAYSPYHRVVDGTPYPAVLFTVFDGDTRVDTLHARKMAAALQHASTSDPATHPVLVRYEREVGHSNRALSRTVDLSADTLAFLAWATGLRRA
jgi:prolyl oligopeptidase